MDFESLLREQLSGDGLAEISKQIGADKGTTGQAVSVAVPLLVSALARNSAKPEGAASLFRAIERDHDGSVLGDFQGFMGNPQAANGAGILRHVLGNQQEL